VRRLVLLVAGILGLSGCADESTEVIPADDRLPTFVDADAEFPRVDYPGDGVTVNDRCPVRQAKLNRKMKPIHANGRPVGFC